MARLVFYDEPPARRLVFDDEPQKKLVFDDEEEDSVLWKSLRSLGRGLTTSLAGALELPGKVSAIPTKLGLTEQTGEYAGMDLPYQIANAVRKMGPEKSESGIGYGLLEGIGSIPGTALKYGAALASGGPIGAAVAMGATDLAEKLGETGNVGEALKAGLISGAVGGALGGAAKIANPLARAAIGAGTMGGASLVEGASPQEAAMNAVMGAGLGAAFRERVKAGEIEGAPVKPTVPLAGEPSTTMVTGDPLLKPRKFIMTEEGLKPNPNDFPVNMSRQMDEPQILQAFQDNVVSTIDELNSLRKTQSVEDIKKGAFQFSDPELHARMQKQYGDVLPEMTYAINKLQRTYAHDAEIARQKVQAAKAAGESPEVIAALANEERTTAANAATMLSLHVNGASNVGRALRILRETVTPSNPLERYIWETKKKGASDEFLARMYAVKDDPEAMMKLVRDYKKPGWTDKAYETWLNFILSGPKTHIVNMTSNVLNNALDQVAQPLAAVNEAVRTSFSGKPRERFVRESVARAKGTVDGIKAAWVALKNAADGVYVGSGKLENVHALPDKILGIPTPGRALQIEDEVFKAVASTQEAYTLAYRAGRKAGLSHQQAMAEIPQRIPSILQSKDRLANIRSVADAERKLNLVDQSTAEGTIAKAAMKKGQYLTFQEEAGPAGKAIMNLKAAIPGLRYVMPFVQTPLNILKTAVEYSPAGFIKPVRSVLKGKAGAEVSEQVAKAEIGFLLSIPLIVEAYEGNVTGGSPTHLTGGGPSDTRELSNLQQTGWQPYSFVVNTKEGKKYFSYERLEPFATILGIASDLGEVKDEQTGRDMALKLAGAISDNLTNKTFLQGMENIFRLTSDPYRWFDTVGRNYIGSAVPSVFGQIASALDPNVRQVSLREGGEGLAETLQNRIPGLSQEIPAKTTATGKPMQRSGNFLSRALSPVAVSSERPGTTVEKEFARLGYVPSLPDREEVISKVKTKLTDQDREIFRQAYADAAAQVEKVMATPLWERLPDKLDGRHDKIALISRIYSKYRERAKAQIAAARLR